MAPATKIKYDVSDVEAGGGGKQPQPALYSGRIVAATKRTTKANGDPANDIEVQVALDDEEYAHLYTYIGLGDSTRWKLREFTDAIGAPPKGELDLNKAKGKKVLVKVTADTDQDGDYRGRIKNLFKPGSVEDAEVEQSSNGTGDGGTDYSDWSDDDLKAEMEERGVEITGRFTSAKAIAALEEYDGPGSSGDEPEAAASGDVPDIPEALVPDLHDDEDEYSSWPAEDIKSYVEDLRAEGVEVPIDGRYSQAKAITALATLSQLYHGTGAGNTGETDADGDPADEYDSWSDTDLEDEIAARNEGGAEISVSGRKSREKMIEALRADDKPF